MEYDMIDRFLRNNLGDDDYAEYSAALDSLYTPQRKPLTDAQKYALIEKHLGLKQRRNDTVIDQYTGLFYSAKPYLDLIDEAAHGIKE